MLPVGLWQQQDRCSRSISTKISEPFNSFQGSPKMKLSVYFLLYLTCVGGQALRIPNEDVESTSARENTLVGKSDAERNKIKRGEVARLKPEEVAKVRGSMI